MRIAQSLIADQLKVLKTIMPPKASGLLEAILVKDSYLIADNFDYTIGTLVPVQMNEPFVLPKKAIEMIENLSGDIEIDADGAVIRLTCGGVKSQFSTVPVEKFLVSNPFDHGERAFEIDADLLCDKFSSVLYACAANDKGKTTGGVRLLGDLATLEEKEQRVIDFAEGKFRLLATKKEISGQGCNFQRHCHRAIFVGIDHKFNDFIQAIHRIYRFLQTEQVLIDIIYTEKEQSILDDLMQKWKRYNEQAAKMQTLIKANGLSNTLIREKMQRSIGVERVKHTGKHYTAVLNDCVEEVSTMPDNSVDLIHTSIPFSNHYEYTPSYNDFGHNEDNDAFFRQMDFLVPELLRILKPGRIAAIHVKDRILFGNATGDGMPTVDPFSGMTEQCFMKHGFRYMGRIVVLTDVVRENNQTYRLGWTEQCKDGTKMGVGCPEYILLFRKLPTDHSRAYADEPVTKTKDEYTRAQWQLDAHALWRSSGDRLITKEELKNTPVKNLQAVYTRYSRNNVYNYAEHVELAKHLDENGRLPATFMVVAPASWSPEIWDDINRMRTLNTTQSQRRQAMHVCPLQLDIVERIINRYSNPGELVFDPFGGLMTVPYVAIKMGRRGYGVELNPDYYRDGLGYLEEAEAEIEQPTLFDFIGGEG